MQRFGEVSAELSRTVRLELLAMSCVSHLHHIAPAARRVDIDVSMSQVIENG